MNKKFISPQIPDKILASIYIHVDPFLLTGDYCMYNYTSIFVEITTGNMTILPLIGEW